MKRTVITAALLAAFAMPAFAEDPMMKTDDSASMSSVDQATTASTTNQSDMTRTTVKSGMDGGCMHRKNTALNMM